MKEIFKKYKEIIIAILIVAIVVILVGANFYINYQKDFKISNSRITNTVERNVDKDAYYIENGKLYISYDGKNVIEVPGDFSDKKEFDERVANRSDEIFLKDFEHYNPGSSEIKISQNKAEKIADIGFEEAGAIGESGEKESQIMTMEEVIANNFFTMNHNCISEIYTNVKRL